MVKMKTDCWVFSTYCVKKRVFIYLSNVLCGFAARPVQVKVLNSLPGRKKPEVGKYDPCVLLQGIQFANQD